MQAALVELKHGSLTERLTFRHIIALIDTCVFSFD